MTEKNDQNPTPPDDQQIYVPLQKKETIKVWTLTIILHLIIALALIAYWKFYHKPEPQHTPTTNKQPVEPMEDTPMKTPALIASIVASTAIASTTHASTTKASTPKIASQPTNTPQPNNNPNTATAIKPNTTNKTPTPASKPMPTPIPAPTTQTTTTTTTITKKEVYEAPVTQALTERDLPSAEKPKNNVATAEQNKEANELSEDIDAKNKELSNLINQVKKQNQQKIDKEIKQPFNNPTETPTTEKTPKLATSDKESKTETDNQE